MKSILKGEKNRILLLLLLTLMIILWARTVVYEIRRSAITQNLDTLLKRCECLEEFGWQVDPGSEKCEKVKIPKSFDEAYASYNELQKKQGFDLALYRGKTVMKYTYIALTPPENVKDVFYINILVYENNMIGGDVQIASRGAEVFPLGAVVKGVA